MIGKIALSIAENLFGDAITEQKERLTSAAKNVINDGIEGILTGTRTIEEWAEIAIKGVDKIIKQKINQSRKRTKKHCKNG